MNNQQDGFYPPTSSNSNNQQQQFNNVNSQVFQNLLASMNRPQNTYQNYNMPPPMQAPHPQFSSDNVFHPMHPQPDHQATTALLHQLIAQAAPIQPLPIPPPHIAPQTVVSEPPRPRQTRSEGTKGGTNSYASRHQQAEARRRSRINERLEALRVITPHTERANTATLLEDVIRYIERLQSRVYELETKLGLPLTVTAPKAPITFGEGAPTPDASIAAGSVGKNVEVQNATAAILAVLQHQQMMHPAVVGGSMNGGVFGGSAAATVVGNGSGSINGASGDNNANNVNTTATTTNTNNNDTILSTHEELAMAAQLAPQKESEKSGGGAEAESQPVQDDVAAKKKRRVAS